MGNRPATLRKEICQDQAEEAVFRTHQPLRKTDDGVLIDPWGKPFTVVNDHPRMSLNVRRALYLLYWLDFDAWPVLDGQTVEIRYEAVCNDGGKWGVAHRYCCICVRDGLGKLRSWLKQYQEMGDEESAIANLTLTKVE